MCSGDGQPGRGRSSIYSHQLPCTVPPEEAVGCIKVISLRVVVPYHQGESNLRVVADALEGSGVEVRVLVLP